MQQLAVSAETVAHAPTKWVLTTSAVPTPAVAPVLLAALVAGVDPTAALSAPLTTATSTPSGTPVVTPCTAPVTSQLLGEGLASLPQKPMKKIINLEFVEMADLLPEARLLEETAMEAQLPASSGAIRTMRARPGFKPFAAEPR